MYKNILVAIDIYTVCEQVIIVGSHGIQLLLGSTANAVLHHAKIDVLAVRAHV